MRIITVSREFGSGGRELGKRMADELGIAYGFCRAKDTIRQNHGPGISFTSKGMFLLWTVYLKCSKLNLPENRISEE